MKESVIKLGPVSGSCFLAADAAFFVEVAGADFPFEAGAATGAAVPSQSATLLGPPSPTCHTYFPTLEEDPLPVACTHIVYVPGSVKTQLV